MKKTSAKTIKNTSAELLEFIHNSPSVFHAADNIGKHLEKAGFCRLAEGDRWSVAPGGKYYVTRNNSSVIAFDVPENERDYHFQIAASHSDSPAYKIKAEAELCGPDEYLRLNVEGYGGMIDHTWLDRPLSVAGRVLVRDGGTIRSHLVYIDRDILLIPSVAIHLNREVNSGYAFNRQIDLCPLFSAGTLKKGDFDRMIANELGVAAEDIAAKDLFLVNRQPGVIWGYADEFISSPKLDDLQAAFASLKGFIGSKNPGCVNIYCCFDNEEVGSNTKQGAMSTFLRDALSRINLALGKSDEELHTALAKSFMVSFDNAHAVHPNHPEKTDSVNKCFMNRGIVIKENAAQKYTTDAFSRAVFREICAAEDVPTQLFANRSDMAGGSTLGNLSNIQVSLHALDIGLPQLAMHSSFETAGSADTGYAIDAMRRYYSSLIRIDDSESFRIEM